MKSSNQIDTNFHLALKTREENSLCNISTPFAYPKVK